MYWDTMLERLERCKMAYDRLKEDFERYRETVERNDVLEKIAHALEVLSLLNSDQTLSDSDRATVQFMMNKLIEKRDMISNGS